MNALQLNIVLDYKCLLGEGPVWDDKRKSILWVDILKGEIHEFSTKENLHKVLPVHQLIGSLALCPDGNFVAAVKSGFVFIDRINGEIKGIANPEAHRDDNRFNEGKCDPAGRFLAGTMSLFKKPNEGSLYALESDYSVSKKISGFSIPNGMAWSGDHRTFYHIDTPTSEVVSYEYNCETGSINNGKPVIKISEQDGLPDGMTIDSENMLWIAHWNGWQITRWNPTNGKKLLKIALPVANVTSCTFGGDDLQDIYITTAHANLTEKEISRQPLAGSLFVIKNSGFTGIRAYEFNR